MMATPSTCPPPPAASTTSVMTQASLLRGPWPWLPNSWPSLGYALKLFPTRPTQGQSSERHNPTLLPYTPSPSLASLSPLCHTQDYLPEDSWSPYPLWPGSWAMTSPFQKAASALGLPEVTGLGVGAASSVPKWTPSSALLVGSPSQGILMCREMCATSLASLGSALA